MSPRASMRPTAGFFAAAAAFTLAAATLLFAQSETGDYTTSNLGAVNQPAMHAANASAKYSVGSYPYYWPEPEFPAGEGKDLVLGYCNACHSPRYILMQPPLSREQWTAEVTKMVKTFGMPIPDEDQTKIINYLAAHFTLETRKK